MIISFFNNKNKIFYGGVVYFEIMLYMFLIVIKLINIFMILYFF